MTKRLFILTLFSASLCAQAPAAPEKKPKAPAACCEAAKAGGANVPACCTDKKECCGSETSSTQS